MAEYQAKVSFLDMRESAVDAVVSVADEHLAIEVSGRSIGRWPIDELSPRLEDGSLLVSAEGEHLVIDVTDPDALRVSLSPLDPPHSLAPRRETSPVDDPSPDPDARPTMPGGVGSPDRDLRHGDEIDGARAELNNLRTALAEAQTQLRWVQELVPRRLPIPVREGESGLGVVQGVRLKERRPLPGPDGLQPWVVVDSGNVYVTSSRLVFSGAQNVEFEYSDINKKGASRTGLLLGVSSRPQSQILAGPGERLAVVLTAAEKLARGVDPTIPFREAISWLTSELERIETGTIPAADAISGVNSPR